METITRNKKEATLLYLKEKHVFPDLHFFFSSEDFYLFPVSFFFSSLAVNDINRKSSSDKQSTVMLKIDKTGYTVFQNHTLFFFSLFK